MKIFYECDQHEKVTNIGIAKALTEGSLSENDLREIAGYLLVFSDARKVEKGGDTDA